MLTVSPQLSAQEAPKTAPSAQQDQPAAGAPDQTAKSFTGTIVKDGDQLVLKDAAGTMTYQLDDQAKAKKFEGKTVEVMGSLASSNTIHVASIKATS